MDTIASARQVLPRPVYLDIYTAPVEFEAAPPMLSSSKTAEQLTLAEAVELIVYGASCNRCQETRRLDLAQLRDRLGVHFLVGDLRPRLRCSKCGNRNIIVVTLWQSASSTSSMSVHRRARCAPAWSTMGFGLLSLPCLLLN